MYSYKKRMKERENYIEFIKIWENLSRPIVINCLDEKSDLHHNLERFWFTTWFETVLIYNLIWNGFDLQLDLERLRITTWFWNDYDMFWYGFDLRHVLIQFWFTKTKFIMFWYGFDLLWTKFKMIRSDSMSWFWAILHHHLEQFNLYRDLKQF